MRNNKLHYILLSVGAIALAVAFWMQYRIGVLRDDIQSIQESASLLGKENPEYQKFLESAWPLMREQESLDFYAKIFLGVGAFVLIVGMILNYRSRKSKFYL